MIRLRSDLPFERDHTTRFLPWIVAVMVFLGALALAAAAAIGNAVAAWDHTLAGRLTVQVPASQANAETVTQLVDALRAVPGIAQAQALDDAVARALLEPWLGELGSDLDLPLPIVIDVETRTGTAIDANALGAQLRKIASGVMVDDHRVWLGQLVRVARTAEWISFTILAVIGLAAVATVIFATRSGLAIHAGIINLLHVMGARDAYIARQFQMQAMMLGLRGGIIGSIGAAVVLVIVSTVTAGVDVALLPAATLSPAQWPLLISVPVAAIAIAMATARLTVLRTLAAMP